MSVNVGWDGHERRNSPVDISDFPDDWEKKLDFVYEAVVGARENAFSERKDGVLDRLDRLERYLKYGVAGAGIVGSLVGSLGTVVVQHFLR